ELLHQLKRVFRAIHSIKGGSGFFGLDRIKDLGHDMENVLDMIRHRQLVPTLDIVNVLLDGADLLNEMVNDATHSNDVDISEPLVKLQAIVNGDPPQATAVDSEPVVDEPAPVVGQEVIAGAEETAPVNEDVVSDGVSNGVGSVDDESAYTLPDLPFPLDADEVMAALRQYEYFFRVEYHSADIEGKGRSPRDILQELRQTGAMLGCSVDLDADALPEGEDSCVLLFATVLEPDFAATLLDVSPEQIMQLSEDQLGFGQDDEGVTDNVPVAVDDAPVVVDNTPTVSEVEALPEPDSSELVSLPPTLSAPERPPSTSPTESTKQAKSTPASMSAAPVADSTLRVNVKLLDALMNLAGELVLTRNQLMQIISSNDMPSIDQASQRLDLITSELQEAIMSTRMQPIGVVFSKFRRIVRDLSRDLRKSIELVLVGVEVELDKTIIEALSDPLTHLVRNGVDHGIEVPSERLAAGKPEQATLKLRAFHEAGQVVIEIADDGKGIDPARIKAKALDSGLHDKQVLDAMSDKEIIRLIFAPGFSTAEEVTDISGRGVGMDVVNTNLTELGGVVDIDSELGTGTTVRIKLPLTLAIIPSLLVSMGNERYALPQVNVLELVRVSPNQVKDRIQKIGGALVLRLRGDLLPLIRLSELVDVDPVYIDPTTGDAQQDRREVLHDRRGHGQGKDKDDLREDAERRHLGQSAISIVVVAAGAFQYGLVVDQLLDSEEIVVKPLDRHLTDSKIYAGATIQGDGRVAMILDVVEIGRKMELNDMEAIKDQLNQMDQDRLDADSGADAQSLVLVRSAADEQFAIPLGLVSRIERIDKSQIEVAGGRRAMKYRNTSLVLFAIEDAASVKPCDDTEHLFVIVFSVSDREVGLIVSQIVDTLDTAVAVDQITFCQPGILGSAILHDETTLLVDLFGVVGAVEPAWITKVSGDDVQLNANTTVLVVEDSKFFLNQMVTFVTDIGYNVLTAEDGQLALKVMEENVGNIDLILTDIEMPNMDGLAFTRAVRGDSRFETLPVVAVTSVAGEAAEQRGLDAGIDSYLIKLDREMILNTMAHYLKNGR
ncbi:MAG: response regulator, partial [Candidatus Latescibacteria bacterium]|nr:response regulator [Candidatus Latescibacterota bacterium]